MQPEPGMERMREGPVEPAWLIADEARTGEDAEAGGKRWGFDIARHGSGSDCIVLWVVSYPTVPPEIASTLPRYP